MIEPRRINEAGVFRNGVQVGTIRRTTSGSVFRYADEFFATHATQPGGIALHLPYRERQIETRGYNLHPYFAGLLPEGLRLKAIVRHSKTSEDDMFTLLIASGSDTIGDVSVVAAGAAFEASHVTIDRRTIAQTRFDDLWKRSLESPSAEDLTVPGVQEKISPAMISFPIAGHSRRKGYILKLNPPDKPRLIENEAFFMHMARECGIATAKTWLVHDRDKQAGLLVERFDRVWNAQSGKLVGLHVEDACQLLERYPADKYRVTCAEIARVLEVCAASVPARATFLQLIAFSYLICNGDLHAKNVSVVESAIGWVPSPAYDVLSSLPYGDRSMALQFEGRDDNLRRKYFVDFGKRFGVPQRAVESMLDRLCERVQPWQDRLADIGLPVRREADLKRTMTKRLADLRA